MFAHQKTKSFQLPPTLNHRRPTIQERFTIKPCKQNLKETNPRNRWSRGKKERWVLEKIDLVIKQMKKMDTDESRSERGCLKSDEGCPTKQIKKHSDNQNLSVHHLSLKQQEPFQAFQESVQNHLNIRIKGFELRRDFQN